MMVRMALWRVAPGEISGVSGKTGFKSTDLPQKCLNLRDPVSHGHSPPSGLPLYQGFS